MGIEKAGIYALGGFLADRLLGTGFLGTLAGAAYGGLFTPDAGEMTEAYEARRAKLGEAVKSFMNFDFTDGLFQNAKDTGRSPEELRPSEARAKAQAAAREKQDGFPWGKVLLGGTAAVLGVNMLDNLMTGGFTPGWFAPCGMWGPDIGGILPVALMGLLAWGAYKILC